MKVGVELPIFDDWENERVIRVMAGIELAAEKYPGEPWKVKTVRCNMCGKCCMDLPEDFFYPTIDGVCVHLRPNGPDMWECSLGTNRPHGCNVAEPYHRDYCCIEWETIGES